MPPEHLGGRKTGRQKDGAIQGVVLFDWSLTIRAWILKLLPKYSAMWQPFSEADAMHGMARWLMFGCLAYCHGVASETHDGVWAK